MSLIGQPESYSDMLKRIFVATLAVGILCTFGLAAVSPAFHSFLERVDAKTSIGVLESVKALYVLVPLAVALFARVFLLHDRISDLFRIRHRFDLAHILRPLAEGVGFPTAGVEWQAITRNRDMAMTRTFYRYASFKGPRIDGQMVRTAADRWAWFWCTIEPQAILLIAAVMFAVLHAWPGFITTIGTMALLMVTGWLLWPQLETGAKNQVREILANQEWRAELLTAFAGVAGAADSAST